ncbi:ABC transporter substrate-binding protein/permease [Nocardioides currus]|uniref:ABC transporter substrate-binding protein n=1 Tax=Nocardioides currus TaxID=2133958 RepID=A0A2R7YTV2_9ACTN|nr:ABC transporter substrate-binding protein/permease [Nocardioides currus]PUA79289.1 ABC transporter substrate-binding protein [Nocardioides currus]
MTHRRRTLALLMAWGALLLGLVAPAAAEEPAPAATVVRVGTEGTYPPFTFHDPDTDELTGYDIDVIREVGKRAGWDLQFVEAQFDSIFPALDAGRIDVIANQISLNPEREAKYAFSTPYTFSQGVIVTAADTDDITTLEDLRGKTMAQSSTSNWAQVARDAGGDVRSVESLAQAAELLEQGRVDALVNDNIAVLDYLAASGSTDVKIAGVVEGEETQQALAFAKSDTALRDQADQALADMAKDGTLTEISESYFKADVSVKDGGGEADLSGRDSDKGSWQVVQDATGPMLKALVQYTITLSLLSMALGLVLALLVALARLSTRPWLHWPARAFISLIRGTPLLVQLFIVFYGLPQAGIKFESYPAAVLALSLNVAAYAAEIIRSSILSVPKGQSEAAATVGMGYALTMRRIVLPQAARTAVPPLSNTFISLVKDTSLASGILVADMFRVAQNYAGATTEYLPLYTLAALFYWIVCAVLSFGQSRLETRLERHTL